MKAEPEKQNSEKTTVFVRVFDRTKELWDYVSDGVWTDTRSSIWINVVKTLNLSVRSFLNGNVQTQACAMVFRTLLAIVPALALLFAIGRGFGLQNLLQRELFVMFPAQHEFISYATQFVDSYLNQASEGIFVGVGIVFLLWTLISLVSNVEDCFNRIWGVKEGRGIWRMISDYTAMLLILPVLMVCAGGISILLSSTLDSLFHFKFLTPLVSVLLEFASWLFTWLFFTAVYMLIPNTKVRFRNAFIAGVIAGSAFLLLQWAFVSGQVYVSKYNAIYGSFAFLPLLLLWMQLAWVICFSGAVICYSSQNIFRFNFDNEVDTMTTSYRFKVVIAVAAVVTKRFVDRQPAPTQRDFVERYHIPSRLLSDILDNLCKAGVLSMVVIDEKKQIIGYQPAAEPSVMTVGFVARQINSHGSSDFIPGFSSDFPGVEADMLKLDEAFIPLADKMRLQDMKILD